MQTLTDVPLFSLNSKGGIKGRLNYGTLLWFVRGNCTRNQACDKPVRSRIVDKASPTFLQPMIFHTQDGVTDKNWRNSSMTSAESSIWKSGVSSRTKARSTESFPFSPVACLDIRVRDTSCWWLVQVSTLRTVYSAWQYESMIWVNLQRGWWKAVCDTCRDSGG